MLLVYKLSYSLRYWFLMIGLFWFFFRDWWWVVFGEGLYYKIFKRFVGDYIYNKVLRKILEIINFSYEVFDRYFKYGFFLFIFYYLLKFYFFWFRFKYWMVRGRISSDDKKLRKELGNLGSLSFGRLGIKRLKIDEEK